MLSHTSRTVSPFVLAMGLLAFAGGAEIGLADVVNLTATKDASIFEESDTAANGAGKYFHVGNNGSGQARRGLVQFDLSSIPAGSTITAVTLTLRMDTGGNTGPTEAVQLRKLTQSWTEGPSNPDIANPAQGGGHGMAAVANDVTWEHRSYSGSHWTNNGGTFSGTISATTNVSNVAGSKTWSSAQMVTDVQGWFTTPANNFGWLVLGDEAVNSSARRFSSRTNVTVSERPKLAVTYTPPAGTGACCAPAGTCTTVTNASCTGGGGVFQGLNVPCNPCPQPVGKCCFGNGTCVVQSSADCTIDGGIYGGNGTICFPACPVLTGACCRNNATCSVVSEAACDALPGNYQGDNVTCGSVVCNWVLTPFLDPLPIPAVAVPTTGTAGDIAHYDIAMREFFQQLHTQLPPTRVWGYNGMYPGPTIEARRDRPVTVTWINDLRNQTVLGTPLRIDHVLPVDFCLHGPDVTGRSPVTVVHLHGAHLRPNSDGFPDDVFRPGQASSLYDYPNNQHAATLWYHDHALGLTRLNVYMGLAGFYLIRDDPESSLNLPRGHNEIVLVIQDRSFNADGSLKFNQTFSDQFFGDFITVNGKVWPYLDVRQGKYRFRIVNGSNMRTYTLSAGQGNQPMTIHQIGSDLGLLEAPVPITHLTLMPGERAEVIIDFAGFTPGSRAITMRNSAVSPFPGGGGGPDITNVMQFRATATIGHTDPLPATLVPVPRTPEASATVTRTFKLAKVFDPVCSHDVWQINALMWDDITDFPVLGSTEIWRWVNQSGVSHPMHIHLVEFQVLDRQEFTVDMNGNIIPTPGTVVLPEPGEMGWKDTVQATPNRITRVISRFLDYPGTFPFHCHILDHEDHEMMRQFTVVCPPIMFATQPASISVARGQNVSLTAVASGAGPMGYQWRRTDPDVIFVNGPTGNGSTVSGAIAPTFTISNVQFADAGRHACFATDVCGVSAVSNSAIITVLCAADFNLDGTVTVQDIFDFLAAFFANSPSADWNNNGAVSIQDIFDYLASFFGPC